MAEALSEGAITFNGTRSISPNGSQSPPGNVQDVLDFAYRPAMPADGRD